MMNDKERERERMTQKKSKVRSTPNCMKDIHIKLPYELYDHIRGLCEEMEISISEFIRNYLNSLLVK